MFNPLVLLLCSSLYLLILFAVAAYAQRGAARGRSLTANAWVYALSLTVYCTSWTFYGSVGKAVGGGYLFLTTYVGPTLTAVLWWWLLGKIIHVAQSQRITTIADFIGARHGNSAATAALVTLVITIGIGPYLGLQVKAVLSTVSLLTGDTSHGVGLILIGLVALFTAVFGIPRGRESPKHEGLIFGVAVESLVKLTAFLAVGIFVSFVLFDNPFDLMRQASAQHPIPALNGGDWTAMLLLSMSAFLFLPRQFQVAVVENHNPDHIRKAMWLTPLYMLVINLFVLPIAYGGLLLGHGPEAADSFVLLIPLQEGQALLALLVFLGGFSAASGMIIVETLAISNMIMNNLVNPIAYRFDQLSGYALFINGLKRMVIVAVVGIGYLFAVLVGDDTSLVDMGLISFEATAVFAPTLLLGLFWKGGNRLGALAGIGAGFLMWTYTLMIPSWLQSGLLSADGFFAWITATELGNPNALFGMTGMGKWGHALFWILFANLSFYFGFSLFTRQSEQEQQQALRFVSGLSPSIAPEHDSVEQIEALMTRYLGKQRALETIDDYLMQHQISRAALLGEHLRALREEARARTAATLGSAVAAMVFERGQGQDEQQRRALLQTITNMNRDLRLSRTELAQANQQLALLKTFRENIIESLPQGVASLDAGRVVRYWNRAMGAVTAVPADEMLNQSAVQVLQRFEPDLNGLLTQQGVHACRLKLPDGKPRRFNLSVTPLKGAEGVVLVLEDVTERMKMEEELFQSSKHASIGRLAAGVSHEIGNPLASISSLVQEMMEEENATFVDDCLGTVNHHLNRIARIVQGLGDFARIHKRGKVLVSLTEVTRNTLDLIRYDAGFRKIDVINLLPEDLPPLMLDPDQMQQLLLNLLLNARDAMPEGGRIELMVEVSAAEQVLHVRDTGPGLESGLAAEIFDPFFTTKPVGKGTGLGLSICYSIVKDHNGSIEVNSDYRDGADFVIRLPR